jgi:D-alanyl-D-alanine carboxypeptidase
MGRDRDLTSAVTYLQGRSDGDPARLGGIGLSVGGGRFSKPLPESEGVKAVVGMDANPARTHDAAAGAPHTRPARAVGRDRCGSAGVDTHQKPVLLVASNPSSSIACERRGSHNTAFQLGVMMASHANTHDRPARARGAPRRTPLASLVCLLLLGALAAPSYGSPRSTDARPDVQRELDAVVAAGAPGTTVLVRHGNRTVQLTSGVGDVETQRPIGARDRTRIGGVTKSFVAAVILQLVDERKLSLNDTLGERLPGLIPSAEAVTVRQLLNHTSGIFNYTADENVLAPYLAGDLTQVFDPLTGVQVAADKGQLFAPGSALDYSNTNFLLLALIAERMTGRSIDELLTARVFLPLRLRHTSCAMSSEIQGPHVHGYLPAGDPLWLDVTAFSPTLYGAAGAIVSTPSDVARFYRALLQGRLVPRHLVREMQTIDPIATGGIPDAGILGGGWGLGLLREEFPCGQAWGHDSETPGYMTAAWNSKDGRRQVVVVVNTSASHDEPVSAAMRQVLVTAFCGPIVRDRGPEWND